MAAGAGCSGRRLQGLVGASAGLGDVPPPEMPTCNGRALWAIVGAITLSSPLLVLLTQVHLGAGSRLGCESRRELLCLCILAAPNSCWSLTAVCLPQQRWIRPDPQDFAKADAGHRGRYVSRWACFAMLVYQHQMPCCSNASLLRGLLCSWISVSLGRFSLLRPALISVFCGTWLRLLR